MTTDTKIDVGVIESVDEIPARFKRLKDRERGDSWILLLYGPSKSGKTFFAGTAGPRTFFINIGDGLTTLQSPAFTSRYPKSADMITVDIRETGDDATAFEAVFTAIDDGLTKFSGEWDTLVIDEATALRKFAMNKSMELNTAARTRGHRGSRLEKFVLPEIGDYGVEMQMIEWFLGQLIPILKQERKNLILIAHERQIYGKPAKIGDEPPLKKIVPGFTGKTFPDKVPAFFDDVWRSEVVGGEGNQVYRIRTGGTEARMGGSRNGGIFAIEEKNPNFLAMLERIRNSVAIPSTNKR